MMLRPLSLLRVTHLCALAGAVAGLGVAARQIAPERYVSHGLWRTTLWIAAHDTLLGAALSAAAGLALVLSLARRLRSPPVVAAAPESSPAQPPASPPTGVALHAALSFTISAAAAVILMPIDAPDLLGVPYLALVAACLCLAWLGARWGLTALLEDATRGRPLDWFALQWPLVLGLAYLVALSHLWARVPAGWWTVGLAGGGLLATIGIYTALHRRVELLVALLRRRGGARFWRSCARGAVVAVSAASLLLWSAAWVAGVRTRARARRAGVNVILIGVDTLRKDGVSLLSEQQHERDLTPNLRALLAPRSTVFSSAISQAPWTLPAFASIFTGLYPEEHGAEHITSRLLPEQLTLAEILRDAGYSTMAVVAFHFLTSDLGMTQGFTICDESQSLGPLAITSAEVTDRAIALLAERRHQPFFLFLHYFDPHYVFRDHPEFDFSPDDLALTGLSNLPPALRKHRDRPAGPAEQARFRAYYDEEIAYTDLHIGRLLAFLEESGLRDSTCVIFTADHGEEFFDHGSTGHEKTLFQELVHVPLAIAHPSRAAPAVVREPVETRWLFGTILDLVGVRRPGKAASARSVFTQPGEKAGLVRSSTYPRPPVTDDPSLERVVRLSCVIDSKYKLIKDHTKDRISLFDLEHDPAETRDLSADMADRARELRATLEAWDRELQEATPSRQAPELTDAERQRLKSLGYL